MSTPSAKISVDLKVMELLVSGIRTGVVPANISEYIELSNGTTDGRQCDKVYTARTTGIAASTTTDYDLAGTLKDVDAATISFAEVCLIAVRNLRTTAGAVLAVGPAVANGFGTLAGGKGFWNAAIGAGGGNCVGPALASGFDASNSGASWMIVYDPTGVPVTAGTGDLLSVVTSAVVGSTNSWDIVIIGRSA